MPTDPRCVSCHRHTSREVCEHCGHIVYDPDAQPGVADVERTRQLLKERRTT